MNEAEVRTMLNAFSANYKGFVRPDIDKRIMLNNWCAAFRCVLPDAGMKAAIIYMQTNKFPPTIADVFELVPLNGKDQKQLYDPDGDRVSKLTAMLEKWKGGKE